MKNGKLIIAMLSLVLLGFAGGYGTHFLLVQQHVKNVARLSTGKGFTERMMNVLTPTAEQEASILPILEKHRAKVDSLGTSFRKDRRQAMDELREKLNPILTEEQKQQLHEHLMRVKKRYPPHFANPENHAEHKRLKRGQKGIEE